MSHPPSSLVINPESLFHTGFNLSRVRRDGLILSNGSISDVFRVSGPVCIIAMFMEITEAISSVSCKMSWLIDHSKGAGVTPIGTVAVGSNLDIIGIPVGGWIWNELDGTALVKAEAGTVLPIAAKDRRSAVGLGVICPAGGIDIKLSTDALSGGKGDLYIEYIPLRRNACIYAAAPGSSLALHSTTTSTSSTTSSSSSTASTASTSSSTTSSSTSSSSTTSTTTTAAP